MQDKLRANAEWMPVQYNARRWKQMVDNTVKDGEYTNDYGITAIGEVY